MTKTVSLIYIPADQNVFKKCCDWVSGMTVRDVIKQSDVYEHYPETKQLPIGIFSRLVSLDTLVEVGDRVEIYRQLTLSPMDKRRQRAGKRRKKCQTHLGQKP